MSTQPLLVRVLERERAFSAVTRGWLEAADYKKLLTLQDLMTLKYVPVLVLALEWGYLTQTQVREIIEAA